VKRLFGARELFVVRIASYVCSNVQKLNTGRGQLFNVEFFGIVGGGHRRVCQESRAPYLGTFSISTGWPESWIDRNSLVASSDLPTPSGPSTTIKYPLVCKIPPADHILCRRHIHIVSCCARLLPGLWRHALYGLIDRWYFPPLGLTCASTSTFPLRRTSGAPDARAVTSMSFQSNSSVHQCLGPSLELLWPQSGRKNTAYGLVGDQRQQSQRLVKMRSRKAD